ncbi:MAG: HEAT repeat domain-containing protein [Candidatus Lokiarchaeia archaeon]
MCSRRSWRIAYKKAIGPLIEALKDEDQFVRLAAAEALIKIGDSSAIEHINQAIEDEKTDYIQKAMIKELKKLE